MKKKDALIVRAEHTADVETVAKEKINAVVTEVVNALSKEFYRDITVSINIEVK